MKPSTLIPLSLSIFSSANPVFPTIQDSLQLPLKPQTPPIDDQSSPGITTLEVEAWEFFGSSAYVTPIAVGTPNQVFRAFIDLDFGGLLVRGIDCTDCGYGDEDDLYYNSSASSTFKDGDERFAFMVPATHIRGQVSRDDVHLVHFWLQNVTLGAVDEYYGENWFYDILSLVADGAIGLAPPNAEASMPYTGHRTANILSHLLTQSPLAQPLMTFSLPQYGEDRGSITLGGLPPGRSAPDNHIPVLNNATSWIAPVTTLALTSNSTASDSNITLPISSTLSLAPTLTSTSLLFPPLLLSTVYKHLHALDNDDWADVKEFNCSFRGLLPDITFRFPGTDVEISFTEEEYSLHGFFGDEEFCVLKIMEFDAPPSEAADKVAMGSMFWEKYEVVFGFGEEGRSMGLIERENAGQAAGTSKVVLESLRRRK